MAIDTAAKRRSAIATRRLPWFRRFLPAPDGSMTQEDRQQVAFVYIGILAEEAVEFDEVNFTNELFVSAEFTSESFSIPDFSSESVGIPEFDD